MDISKIMLDLDKVDNGEWVSVQNDPDGLKVKVRSTLSVAYQKAYVARRNSVPRAERLPDGEIPMEVEYRVNGEAYAEAILLDWDGLLKDGKPIPYDKELANRLLTVRDAIDFRLIIVDAAGKVGRSKEIITETIMGN